MKNLDDAIMKAVGVKVEKADTEDLLTSEIGNFLPVEYANEFIALIRERNHMRDLVRTVNMTTQTLKIPRIDGDANVYYVGTEATAPSKSDLSNQFAGQVELNAKKLMAYSDIANEVDEDSKIAMLPLIKEAFAEGMAAAEEIAMVQGNTAFAWTNAADVRKAMTGVVYQNGVSQVGDNNDLIATVEAARYKLGRYGRDVKALVLMVNPFTAGILRQEEAVLTVDKYGPNATIHKGELGKIMGIAIIESAYIPEDATTKDTVEDFATNGVATKAVAMLFRKDSLLLGDRRAVKFDSDKIIETDATRIVISERIAFTVTRAEAICKITDLANSKT